METVEAIYENGILRPIQPLDLEEGKRVRVIIGSEDDEPARSHDPEEVKRLLDEIAALPPEGDDPYAGWTHDEVIYGTRTDG